VNNKISKHLKRRKQRIQYRLRDIHWNEQDKPMFSASNIHYEIAERSRGLAYGGIGCMHLLARRATSLKIPPHAVCRHSVVRVTSQRCSILTMTVRLYPYMLLP